jgi:hypothetical protein
MSAFVALPQPVAAYIQAANDHDSTAFIATFTDDALVTDDGHSYRGTAAILAWNEHNVREYAVSMLVTEVVPQGAETAVTAQVSGTFDGSPATFRYTFTCAGGKIARLHIEYLG